MFRFLNIFLVMSLLVSFGVNVNKVEAKTSVSDTTDIYVTVLEGDKTLEQEEFRVEYEYEPSSKTYVGVMDDIIVKDATDSEEKYSIDFEVETYIDGEKSETVYNGLEGLLSKGGDINYYEDLINRDSGTVVFEKEKNKGSILEIREGYIGKGTIEYLEPEFYINELFEQDDKEVYSIVKVSFSDEFTKLKSLEEHKQEKQMEKLGFLNNTIDFFKNLFV